MKLPPFGRDFILTAPHGIRVVIGDDAWNYRNQYVLTHGPIMVLPPGEEPCKFCWPADGKSALIIECDTPNDERLKDTAHELLLAGASSVVALRERVKGDNRVFFDPEGAK